MATATYPPPPPYYRLYKDYEQDPSSAPEPPPIKGTYLLYGANYTTDDVLPSLEDQGVHQLYPKRSKSCCRERNIIPSDACKKQWGKTLNNSRLSGYCMNH